MRQKIRLGIEVLLVLAAIVITIYNFSNDKKVAYMASIVAVLGTVAILAKDIYKGKNNK